MPRITKSARPKIRVTPCKPAHEKLSDAYERLGVTPSDVAKLPVITEVLKKSLGKVDRAYEYLRGSHDADARKFLVVFDDIPNSIRIKLPIEAFCAAAGLEPKRVLELITSACFEQNGSVTELIFQSARPKIAEVAIKAALKQKNLDDRKLVMQKLGDAPVPKTQVVNVGGNMNVGNQLNSISINELTGIEKGMAKLNDKFNERLGIGPVVDIEPELEPALLPEDTNEEIP